MSTGRSVVLNGRGEKEGRFVPYQKLSFGCDIFFLWDRRDASDILEHGLSTMLLLFWEII